METVSAREVALLQQLLFGFQPVLDVLPGSRSLVYEGEIGPSGNFVRGGRKIIAALI